MAHRTIIGGLFCAFCEVNISIYFCDGNLFPSQIENNMIDTNQLSALVSAFRVETEKESISPETVGKLLQDILDLLATASSDTERKILDDWKALLSQYTVVYDVAHATGMADGAHVSHTARRKPCRIRQASSQGAGANISAIIWLILQRAQLV